MSESNTSQDETHDSITNEDKPAPPPPPPTTTQNGVQEQDSNPLLLPPAPPPPISYLAPPRNFAKEEEIPSLRVVSGNLTTALRTSHRASRWLLVILDYSSELPFRLRAPVGVTSTVNGWRPRKDSSFAESYTSFFPSSGQPHIALLDPRSGERLHVWGEPSSEDAGDADVIVWESLVDSLESFVAQHSVEGYDLGPFHHRDKPWAVRTKRDSLGAPELPPTSAMDDEDVAIAAAIAASLAEAKKNEPSEFEFDDYSDDEELDDDDEGEDEMDTDEVDDDEDVSMSTPPASSDIAEDEQAEAMPTDPPAAIAVAIPGANAWPVVGSEDITSDTSGGGTNAHSPSDVVPSPGVARPPATPHAIPVPRVPPRSVPVRPITGGSPALAPSSVESLASSYIERLHSRYRSQHDPALAERRALREEQDAELAASLEQDRRKEEERLAEERREREHAAARGQARERLPEEPVPPAPAVSVALRLPDGQRISRAFPPESPLSAVADLCLAVAGLAIVERPPAEVLWARDSLKPDTVWTATIKDVSENQKRVLYHVQIM